MEPQKKRQKKNRMFMPSGLVKLYMHAVIKVDVPITARPTWPHQIELAFFPPFALRPSKHREAIYKIQKISI